MENDARAPSFGWIGRTAAWAVIATVMLMLGYATVGLIGGAVPVNAGWRPPAQGVTIYVENNGVHTDLVLPVAAAGVDWRHLVRPGDFADPRYAGYDHLAFGWGERKFYLETPFWSDLKPATVLRAAIGSGDTALHVEYLPVPVPSGDVRKIVLRPDEYRRLAAFVRASFASQNDQPILLRHGYFAFDTFYGAKGHYDAFVTCNAWTGRALRTAGIRVGWWTPFPVTVMGWF